MSLTDDQTRTAVLEARSVSKAFALRRDHLFAARRSLWALSDVDLTIAERETVAVVGESGSGKSTLGRILLGLIPPTEGHVVLEGEDLTSLGSAELRRRRRSVQMVFQDPYGSLNPRKRIGAVLAQPYRIHKLAGRQQATEWAEALLETVGLTPSSLFLDRYPHQLSGGQRQRVAVARAISLRPKVIVADEPVSALDVSVRAQILGLLLDLRDEMGLSYVFITHDLSVARAVSDRVIVLYLGRVVESGTATELFSRPQHPYTKALLGATPSTTEPRNRKATRLEGEIPSPVDMPAGCPLHTRCPFAKAERCPTERPVLRTIGPGHDVACHYAEEIQSLTGEYPLNASSPN